MGMEGHPMGERRQSERRRSFLKGRISFNGGRATLDCLVRDISEYGARLKVSETFVLPRLVELYMPSKNATLKGKIAWRTSDEIGLEFVDVHAQNDTPDDLAGRVHCMEGQLAILERKVAELRAILYPGQDREKRDARRDGRTAAAA
jgi:hypothetical protein